MTNEESEAVMIEHEYTQMTYGTVSKETKEDMTQLGKKGLRQEARV
jgi:hypothetical protein